MDALRWHCTSCGTKFAADGDARCPKCLKQSSVVREEAPAVSAGPAVYVAPEPELPPQPPGSRALVLAALPAVIAAVLMAGIGGSRIEPLIAIMACLATAPLAGFLLTGDRASRVYATIASMIASVGVVFAAAWALRANAGVAGLVLGVSMIVGFVPGLTLFFAFRLLTPKPVVRILLAFFAVVTTAFVVTTC